MALGETLHAWSEEIVAMWRFARNNGITEGFHTKMEALQRQAYGFRNFGNYRLRVKAMCSRACPQAECFSDSRPQVDGACLHCWRRAWRGAKAQLPGLVAIRAYSQGLSVARPERFELPTYWFEASNSQFLEIPCR